MTKNLGNDELDEDTYIRITEQDYSLIDRDDIHLPWQVCFENTEEKWYGIIVEFKNVRMKLMDENMPTEYAVLSYDYDIIDDRSFGVDNLKEDNKFNKYLGNLLRYIIITSLEQGVAKIGKKENDAEASDDNSKKSITE